MKFTIKAATVIVLTVALAKIAYMWSALDPLFNSHAWQRLYVMLATWLNITGPEEGDNLVMVVIIAASFVLALILVSLGTRFLIPCFAKHDATRDSAHR